MPCPVYCLPKDHKEGELKGRPIHAATDTPATQLSKYLAKELNKLLCYVPAHLRNTTDFIEFLSDLDGSSICGFCSLDVCNLYGSIPLEDYNEKTPGIFTITIQFFHQYKEHCGLHALEDDDFETLVRLCLTSDSVLIGSKSYKQKSGLAMGNNLAPSLAIIYMNEVDLLIVRETENQILLKRFIDDYFAILLSSSLSAERLLTIANSLNDKNQFTLETPHSNTLPFLDTLVSYDSEAKSFSTQLYIKPIHSRSIMPWDSHGSISSKRAILIGETKRAIARMTNSSATKESLKEVKRSFVNNGYPKAFVDNVIRKTKNNRHNKPAEDCTQKSIYLKLPYINEDYKRRAMAIVRRSGIKNVKICFLNGKPLSKVFSAPKDRMNCPEECKTCKSAKDLNNCFKKNVVYEKCCSHCGSLYVGETGRTIGSRIKEHLKMNKQTVYKHIMNHKRVKEQPSYSDITWKIIYGNIQNHRQRKCIEAMEIQKHSGNIMNGCVGRVISI